MNPQPQGILQKAIEAFHVGNSDGADSILRKVLQNDLNTVDTIFELGITYAKANRLMEASVIFSCLQIYKKEDVRIPYNLGLIHLLQGKHKLALDACDLALQIQPDDAPTLINKSAACNRIKNYTLALEVSEKVIRIRPDIPEAWYNKGDSLYELNRYDEAIVCYDKALSLQPDYHQAWSNKGVTLQKFSRYDEAIACYDKALSLQPDYAEAWSNKGVILNELKRYDEAIVCYDKALSLQPDYHQAWSNKGVILNELKRYEEAIFCYDKALSLKPDYAEAWSNKGVILSELKRYVTPYDLNLYEGAIACYDKALSLKPDYHEAWTNKGNTLNDLKRYEGAIACYDKALSLQPNYHEAWSFKGITLQRLKCYDEAIACYDKALSLNPFINWVAGYLLYAKMKICDWSDLADSLKNVTQKVITNEKVIHPFALMALLDDNLMHKKCSEIFAKNRYPANPSLGPISKSAKKEKIRIAYFSPDFLDHPVSFLTSELFEIHDRDKFEVFAFSFRKAAIGDETNLRLRIAFDRFMDVDNMSDSEVAQLARTMEVDIAIDLAGPTEHSRTGIFAYRAAPIQVNWLGYPGTIGADFIDYIVADHTIIPASHYQMYTEKVVSMPNTYMVDDSKRIPSSRLFTRSESGLPETGFVYCCFNNDYKFNPQVLDSWSRILLTVKDSVLWISENNQGFRANITTEFEKRGIHSSRIIFAQRVELMKDHLARYALADLFLDTYPYNAHTTAVDSLKVGIPLITLIGQSFASRVAASLLNAISLPELIANTQEEYESLAIELATNPKKLTDIKLKLIDNRFTTPLFNTPLFAKNIETAFIKMVERYQADLQPDHISII